MAHRGSSAAHAEHTLAAYELALDEGADALECDVRLTRDGVLVCVHDRRIDRVSDGRGVLSTLELADLTDLTQYLDGLAEHVLAACPPETPVTVLGRGHGAAAACRWLAGGRVRYERLLLYDAIFPTEIDRRATLVALPEQPVLVLASTIAGPAGGAAAETPEAP